MEQRRKRFRTLAAGAAMVGGLMGAAAAARATGVAHNVPQGADIVMKELRWPEWDAGTYYCFWYVNFHPEPYCTFYGGLVTRGPQKAPGMFMSYWGQITNIHEGRYFYRHGYGAEGAKGGANGSAEFMRPGCWYRMVLRVFPPAEPGAKYAYVGWWVKDVERNRWYTHSVVRIETPATGVKSNSGFVEALAPHTVHRAFERRGGYCRVNGKWVCSNVLIRPHPKYFRLIAGGTVLRYDRSGPDVPAPPGAPKLTARQPAAPTLNRPAVADVRAVGRAGEVAVSWRVPPEAPPQLGYRIEAFAEPDAKGRPLGSVRENAPHVLARRLDLPARARSVRLTVTDIFDQVVSVVAEVAAARPRGAGKAPAVRPGLRYAYCEAPPKAEWTALPDFKTLRPVREGIVADLDDTVRGARDRLYAIAYRGFLKAPADGLYVLELGTCDGSRLRVDGRLVAENDGIHGTGVRQYVVPLAQGLHAFALEYFKGPRPYLAPKILARWSGPGFGPRPLGEGDFACPAEPATPSVALVSTDGPSPGAAGDNLVTLRARIQPPGTRAERVEFYRDRLVLDSVPTAGGEAVYHNLLPAGKNRLRARLWYDGGRSVDSGILELTVRNRTEGFWAFDTLGESHFPLAVRSAEGRVSFRGDGFCFANRRMKGDFTLTARVAEMLEATPENGVHRANWLGLYLQQDLSRPFGSGRFGIYRTAGQGVRGAADFPDLAGTYMSVASFAPEHRWLRLMRRGMRLTAWTSADGRTWQKAVEWIAPRLPREVHAGLVFRSIPGKSRALFAGTLDHVSLTASAAGEPARRVPRELLPAEGQVLALLQAPGEPGTLYARTLGAGLRRSTDGGATWQSADGRLEGPDRLAVRSVAVSPKDAGVLLRACGEVAGGAARGRLLRSPDGGRSWSVVSEAIDFDGRGAGAMFGEVVAFDPKRPELAAAGGETAGLFLSTDAGRTWKPAGLKGRRITSVAFVPTHEKGRPALVVGTMADTEMEAVGLPRPGAGRCAAGGVFFCELRDGKVQLRPCFELEDLGVTNLAFGTHPNFFAIATTRGVYYTWQRGSVFGQRRDRMPADRFYVALGWRSFMKEWRKDDWRLFVTAWAAPFAPAEGHVAWRADDRLRALWTGVGGGGSVGAGATCILPDRRDGRTVWLCGRRGVHRSTDGGRTWRKVEVP